MAIMDPCPRQRPPDTHRISILAFSGPSSAQAHGKVNLRHSENAKHARRAGETLPRTPPGYQKTCIMDSIIGARTFHRILNAKVTKNPRPGHPPDIK